MQRSSLGTVIAFALATCLGGCGGSNPASAPSPQRASPAATATFALPEGTHQSALSPLKGDGIGGVSVTPKSVPQGTFVADIKVRVQKARANTTYIVQRAPEIGRSLAADGVCQRALGLSPWGGSDAPAPAFLTFMNGTAPYTVMTDATGAGTLDFEFAAATVPAGTIFDVMFRLADNVDAPTVELRSGCFTVTVK